MTNEHEQQDDILFEQLTYRIAEGDLALRPDDPVDLKIMLRAYALYSEKKITSNAGYIERLQSSIIERCKDHQSIPANSKASS